MVEETFRVSNFTDIGALKNAIFEYFVQKIRYIDDGPNGTMKEREEIDPYGVMDKGDFEIFDHNLNIFGESVRVPSP